MAWTASWTATWTTAKSRNGMGLGRAGFAATNACTAMLCQAVAASGSALAEWLMTAVAVAARVLVAELRTADVTRIATATMRHVFLYIPNISSPFLGSSTYLLSHCIPGLRYHGI